MNNLLLPASKLPFSTRLHNCLLRQGLVTIGDILKHTPADILKTKDCGRKTLYELECYLFQMGFVLKGSRFPNEEEKMKRRSSLEAQEERNKRLTNNAEQARLNLSIWETILPLIEGKLLSPHGRRAEAKVVKIVKREIHKELKYYKRLKEILMADQRYRPKG